MNTHAPEDVEEDVHEEEEQEESSGDGAGNEQQPSMERNKETLQIGRKRRKQLDSTLSQYKQQKMKKKVSADTQMMTYAAEELEMKRKMMEKMDLLGKEHRQTMSELASSLKTLSDSVTNAFSALNQVLLRQSYHQQPLAPLTVVPQPNYAHHYNMPVGSTFIPSSSP